MKINLIRPPTFTTTLFLGEGSAAPIGVAYLAACLLESGHSVTAVDAQVPTGGNKASGIGRERGLPGIVNYLELKNAGICI